jgi:tetratricopeptide (TPR) repeat protein
MRFRNGFVFALSASLALGACASAGGAGGGGGSRPSNTKFSTSAQLFIAQAEGAEGDAARGLYQQALDQAVQGVEANANNPQHYYLAGIAYTGLGDATGADSMFTRATELYPDYAADVETAREQGWARAFNAAVNAYNAGNQQEAMRLWEQANRLYDKRPEGFFNLAAVYTQDEQYDRAAQAYRDALAALERAPARELTPEEVADRAESKETAMTSLGQLLVTTEQFPEAEQLYRSYLQENPNDVSAQSSLAVVLAKQGKKAEAMQTYEQLLASPNVSANDVFNIGVGLFQIEEHARAADAFRRATEMNPNNRDAWYNYANALYAQEKWNEVVPVAQRLLQIDPLNENASLILARAYRDTRQNREALRVLETNEAAPIFVNNLQLRTSEGRSTIRGTAEPKSARAGTPVQLRFTFFGPSGELGTQTVTVTAPAAGATANFEAVLQNPTPATGYRYEVVR